MPRQTQKVLQVLEQAQMVLKVTKQAQIVLQVQDSNVNRRTRENEISVGPIRLEVSRRLCVNQRQCKPGILVSKRLRMRQYMTHDDVVEI